MSSSHSIGLGDKNCVHLSLDLIANENSDININLINANNSNDNNNNTNNNKWESKINTIQSDLTLQYNKLSPSVLNRIASEYNQLLFYVSQCTGLPFLKVVQPRYISIYEDDRKQN